MNGNISELNSSDDVYRSVTVGRLERNKIYGDLN